MGKCIYFKEESFGPGDNHPTCYVFEGNGARAAYQNVDDLVKKCIERSNSDLRVCRGDIVTTLSAPQIMFPSETKTTARFMKVPVTDKELSYFYRELMLGIENL